MNAAGWLQRRRKYFLLLLCFKMRWQRVPCPDMMLDEQGASITVNRPKIALSLLFPSFRPFSFPRSQMPGLEVLHWSFSFWLLPEEGSELLPAALLSDRLLSGFPCSQPHIRAPRAVSGASSCGADIPAERLASGGKNNRASTGLNLGRGYFSSSLSRKLST